MFHCPSRERMEMCLGGLIVFGLMSGCNYSETSLQNHKALVWFGQTYDMKLEHDDWKPCSLRSSTNKIIFSQICFCLFFSFPARWSINTDTSEGCHEGRGVWCVSVIAKVPREHGSALWKGLSVLDWVDQMQWSRSFSPSTRERKKEREWWPLTGLNRGFHARDQTPSLFSTLSLRWKTRAPPSDPSPFFLKGV